MTRHLCIFFRTNNDWIKLPMHQIFKPRNLPIYPARVYKINKNPTQVSNQVVNKHVAFHTTQRNFLRIPEPPKKIVRQVLSAVDEDVTEMEILTLKAKPGQLVKEFEKV
jgi:hypothetical protein